MKQRIAWIDNIKAFLILTLPHVQIYGPMMKYIGINLDLMLNTEHSVRE